MSRLRTPPESPKLAYGETYTFTRATKGTRLAVEWTSSNGMIADLDIVVLYYDERSRFIEKLTFDNPVSFDESGQLEADIDTHVQTTSHQENVHFDLTKIDRHTAAIVLFVDGGPRNFQFVQNIIVHCSQENLDNDSSNFMSKVEPGAYSNSLLFQSITRARKDFQGVALNVIFRDGYNDDGSHKWHIKNIFEPLFCATSREKDERCAQIVITSVPELDKYRPRLFPNVKAICSALSSTALPKLKKCFQKGNGLPIKQFTEVIFNQLYETNPRVLEEVEASYTVAQLQDMFSQIDFNGDGAVDWDEFTTFCIHTGLVGASAGAGGQSEGPSASTKDTLDEYVIEYGEDNEIKDNVLNSYSVLSGMRYSPSSKRVMAITEKKESVMMFSDNFEHISSLDPHKLTAHETNEKIKVYDILYIASRDLYVYCASDHTIVICREKSSLGGKKIHYAVVHRIYSSYLHLKLCWSEGCKTLCSVAADNIIYGWTLDGTSPIFHVSRHKDLITDFIAIDSMDLFVTCSLDKRIVLWSQTSRRVKGILLGHKRGVRCLSHGKGVLLSAGFECEARTWDINLKEQTLILKGHRMPVAAGRMMCLPEQAEDNMRAITVDDGGEFRLWNVYVKEKGSQCAFAQVLQVFTMSASEPQVARIKFFELPFEPSKSKGNYSNIIAASSKLIHLIPEKNSAEFVPPTCVCYSEPNACVVMGIGRSMYKYDMSAGSFQSSVNDVDGSDVTCLALDGEYGRRIFVGCTSGNILLLNFATGQILDTVAAHTKEVSALAIVKTSRTLVFSGSFDSRIRCMEEISGELTIHSTADNAFEDGSGITLLRAIESINTIVGASNGRMWGVWSMISLKRIFVFEEKDPIASIEVLGASGDKADIEMHMRNGKPMDNSHYLTIAVCTLNGIRVYTMDVFESTIVVTHSLTHNVPMYISAMSLLRCPKNGSVNYTLNQATSCARFGLLLVAVSEEGYILVWKAEHLQAESLNAFKEVYPEVIESDSKGPSLAPSRAASFEAIPRSKLPISSVSAKNQSDDQSVASSVVSHAEEVEDETSLAGDESVAESVEDDTSIDDGTKDKDEENDEDADADDTDGNEHDATQDSVFSLTTTSASNTITTQGGSTSQPKEKKRRNRRKRVTKNQQTRRGSLLLSNCLVQGEDLIIRETTIKNWKAHLDIVLEVVPLHEHGCFVTVSLDGFNRIWNLDGDILGELCLPNVTEKMKKKRLYEEPSKWKFIMEKIPVTESHRKIAQKLVDQISNESKTPRAEEKERRKAGQLGLIPGGHPLHVKSHGKRMKKTESSDARSLLRWEILHKLNEVESPEPEPNPVQLKPLGKTAKVLSSLDDDDMSSVSDHSSARIMKGRLGDSMSVSSMHSEASKSHRSFGSTDSLWVETEDLGTVVSAPFSESSIASSHQDGLIDGEGHLILRRVNADKDKVDAYNRSVPTVLLRNVGLSTKVQIPSVGTDAESEVNFGVQRGMYKNANKMYAERRKYSTAQARHVVSLARIKANVRRMGDMIDIKEPPRHDLISLPKIKGTGDDDEDEEEIERERQQQVYNALSKSRQSGRRFSNIGFQGPAKTVNKERVIKLMAKISDAETTGVPDWEIQQTKRKSVRVNRKILHRSNTAAQIATVMLEKKLGAAIKNSFRHAMDNTEEKKTLTNRMLLPYYKMSDVRHFLDIFQKVDEDYSGDLDTDEWCKFFTSLNKSVTMQQARAIFNRIDVQGDGFLQINDLIPVVFSKSKKDIQQLIITYIENEVSKRKIVGKDFLKESDLVSLFEHYDENVVGFIPVSFLRGKVKAMELPEAANYEVVRLMSEMDDDEMLNCESRSSGLSLLYQDTVITTRAPYVIQNIRKREGTDP